MRRYVTARSLFQDANTASVAMRSCVVGSSGNAAPRAVRGFVLGDELAQVGDVEVDVGLEVPAFLYVREPGLELGVRHAEHDVAEHVEQAAVGV